MNISRQCLENLTPFYILDDFYNFVDWNYAFQCLIADVFDLEMGDSATKFVDIMRNVEAIKTRNQKVFSIKKVPTSDIETLIIDHPKFGEIRFQKFAFLNYNAQGNFDYWTVLLNVDGCQKLDQLFTTLQAWNERSNQFVRLLRAWRLLIDKHERFSALAVENLQSKKVLLLGTLGADSLYEKWKTANGVEIDTFDNHRECYNANATIFGARAMRGCVERPNTLRAQHYDRIFAPWLPWMSEDFTRCVLGLKRVLKPDGKLVICDPEKWFSPKEFKDAPKGVLDNYQQAFEYFIAQKPVDFKKASVHKFLQVL